MTFDRMDVAARILEEVLEVEPERRAAYLDEACPGDPHLRLEVESLLAAHEAAGSRFLHEPLEAAPAFEALGGPLGGAGRRVGPYLIVDEIGHGGMGEVFRAVRADGQYEKRVALKLVRTGYGASALLERFRQERQILASLDHPGIARLLDGGTTDEGVPYLAMELVEGERIDRFCAARQLPIPARLRLFLAACDAVQYAHRHLVIHRDLKPDNILVAADGAPKLLDFGIAKLLAASGQTEATMLRPLTPAYASPEQVRGEPVTTATDVYSLGVVLYELLAGRSPYRTDARTPLELAGAITNDAPAPPSVAGSRAQGDLSRSLRGDLDAIVLKALRKEPDRRYSSVEQLADDVRRHLEGLPVIARKGTWSYRTSRLIRRHLGAVSAVSLVLLTLAAGIVVTAREARIADENRRRAEARFNDVRALANSLIFEVHDSIQNLPGATDARRLILQRSLQYLDSLSREAGNDPGLQRELATAYGRVAALQGNPQEPNLGDTAGARASLEKLLALREALARSDQATGDDRVALALAYLDYADFLNGAAGRVSEAFDYARKAVAILEREAAADPADERIAIQSTRAYTSLGMMQVGEGAGGTVGTTADGVADLEKALALAEHVLQRQPDNASVRAQEAVIDGVLGDATLALGDRRSSLEYYTRSLESLRRLDPDGQNVRTASNTSVIAGKIGDVLLVEGRLDQAVEHYAEAQALAARLAAADPHNEMLQRQSLAALAGLGHALVENGRFAEGERYIRQALAAADAEPAKTPLIMTLQALVRAWLAEGLEREGRLAAAAEEYARSKALLVAVRQGGMSDPRIAVYVAAACVRVGGLSIRRGQLDQAGREYDEAVSILEPLRQTNPDDQEMLYALAEAYAGHGRLAAARALRGATRTAQADEWRAARDAFDRSLDAWSRVTNPVRISTNGLEVTVPAEVAALRAHADQEARHPSPSK